MELISLKVTEPSFRVCSSIVQAKGIPTSSVLAYLLPMPSAISSILYEMPLATKDDPNQIKFKKIFFIFKKQSSYLKVQ